MMLIFLAICCIAATVDLTASPPSCRFHRRLAGDAVGDLGVLGVLRDRGRHLLDRGTGFLGARRLLAGRLRQRLRGGADFFRGRGQRFGAVVHFLHHVRQFFDHALHRRQQAGGVAGLQCDVDAQVAVRHLAHDIGAYEGSPPSCFMMPFRITRPIVTSSASATPDATYMLFSALGRGFVGMLDRVIAIADVQLHQLVQAFLGVVEGGAFSFSVASKDWNNSLRLAVPRAPSGWRAR
jgi:hypothetical protein